MLDSLSTGNAVTTQFRHSYNLILLLLWRKPLTSKIIRLSNTRAATACSMSRIVCFHAKQNCGESRGNSSLVRLLDCTDAVQSHLSTYHLSRDALSEYALILARSGRFDVTNAEVSNWWVCPRHRHSLGKFWLPTKRSCNMPHHTGDVKTLTGRDVVTYEFAK